VLKVEGHSNLERDGLSKAIINMDKIGYNAYIARKQALLDDRKRIEELEQKVGSIDEKLNKIIELLNKG